MPNWTYNYLDINGSKEDISAIKAQLNKPFTKQHEQWNPETNKMEIKDYPYSNPVFAFHNIYNHIQDGVSDEDYMKQPDHTLPMAEQLQFKGKCWYDWNVRNWGTKWDVGMSDEESYRETEITDETDTSIGYKFNTAWSPPFQAIEKLSAQYPDVEFSLSYEEETGWGGEMLFVNGQPTEIESYDNKCKDCDSLNTLDYCDNDCGQICSECHYLGEAELDLVAECEYHKQYLDDKHVPDYRMDEINV
jgi:hypothetical protein